MLLSWLTSSISVEILSLVVNSNSSHELWTNIEEQFGSKTGAKKVHMKMLLNNLKKGSMTITEYFSKLKAVSDELALAGSPVTNLDFITHLISGLGQPYYPVVRDGNGHRPQRVCYYQTQTHTKFKLPNPPATRSGF